jgi:hypothetical protein
VGGCRACNCDYNNRAKEPFRILIAFDSNAAYGSKEVLVVLRTNGIGSRDRADLCPRKTADGGVRQTASDRERDARSSASESSCCE